MDFRFVLKTDVVVFFNFGAAHTGEYSLRPKKCTSRSQLILSLTKFTKSSINICISK
jgi:hypothetical protein